MGNTDHRLCRYCIFEHHFPSSKSYWHLFEPIHSPWKQVISAAEQQESSASPCWHITALHVYLLMVSPLPLMQSYLVSLLLQGKEGSGPYLPANLRPQINKEAITPYQRASGRDMEENSIHSIYRGVVLHRWRCWWLLAIISEQQSTISLTWCILIFFCLERKKWFWQRNILILRHVGMLSTTERARSRSYSLIQPLFFCFFWLLLICQTPSQLHA